MRNLTKKEWLARWKKRHPPQQDERDAIDTALFLRLREVDVRAKAAKAALRKEAKAEWDALHPEVPPEGPHERGSWFRDSTARHYVRARWSDPGQGPEGAKFTRKAVFKMMRRRKEF